MCIRDRQRNWIWAVIFAAIFAGCLALWLLPRGSGETVLVYQDGQLLRTLDLRQDTVFTVEGPAGENTVTVTGGEVFVSQADCPDQVCVLHGPVSYTHLDVYKRQPPTPRKSPQPLRSPPSSPAS